VMGRSGVAGRGFLGGWLVKGSEGGDLMVEGVMGERRGAGGGLLVVLGGEGLVGEGLLLFLGGGWGEDIVGLGWLWGLEVDVRVFLG